MRDILFLENFPAPALCSKGEKFWISPVHWNAEAQRQLFLPVGCVEGDKMGAIRVGDQRTYSLDQAWSFEQLLAQRTYRTIKRRWQKQPRTRMTRDDAGQQIEVIIDDAWQNRLRSNVDQPGPGLTQQQEEKQKTFFIRLHDCARV